MKKLFSTAFIAGCLLLGNGTANAQWQLNGNANATTSSILGTTNSVPLSMYTKNAKRLTIDTLGRVGIGTATPVNIFTVKGAGSTPATTWTNAGAPLFVGFGETNVGNSDFIMTMASATNSARPVFVGRRGRGTLAAPAVVANNDFLMSFLSSGYDGTGFQNPAAIDFYVDGTPTAGNVPARISFVTGSNSSNRAERLKITNTGDFAFNGNGLFIQKATGNVGIGSSNPIARLQVEGKVKISDGTQGYGKVLTSDSIGMASWQTLSATGSQWTTAGNNIFNNNAGNVGVGTNTPSAALHVVGSLKYLNGSEGFGKVLTCDSFGSASWKPVGAATSYWSLSGNNIYNTNLTNVGIGNLSPNAPLQFANQAATRKIVLYEDGNNNNQFNGFGINPFLMRYQVASTASSHVFFAGKDTGSSVELMRVSGNGNVGINAILPAAKLEVASDGASKFGTILLVNQSAIGNGDGPKIQFQKTMTNSKSWTTGIQNGLNVGNYAISEDGGTLGFGTPRLTIVPGGNVGIGTTTPNGALQFANVLSNRKIVLYEDANNNNQFNGIGVNPFILRYQVAGTSSNHVFYAGKDTGSSDELMRISGNGRVGIGTASAAGQFELSKDEGRKPATSTWTIASDARLKNIDGAYNKGLNEIVQLQPITYHYKNVGERKFDAKTIATQAIGFSAQDVQKVFPEAVGTDADGYLNLNIHPILIASVNAIKEQQKQIEAKDETISTQQKQIAELQAQMNNVLDRLAQLDKGNNTQSKATNQNETVENVEVPTLEQNAPNPVNNTTVIRYRLPASVKAAQMTITDSKGTVIKSFNLNAKGIGQVTLSAGTLSAGSYFYSLITDGRKVATKEMQIIK